MLSGHDSILQRLRDAATNNHKLSILYNLTIRIFDSAKNFFCIEMKPFFSYSIEIKFKKRASFSSLFLWKNLHARL
jgi:hypothetical protein